MARPALIAVFITVIFFGQARARKIDNLEKYLEGYTKTYFIYVDKKINRLYLVDKNLRIWRRYTVATGMKKGDKLHENDLRTPGGVYLISEVCQYHEPWYMRRVAEKIKVLPEGSKTRDSYVKYYAKLKAKYRKGLAKIKAMNSVFLKAEDGHVKYGTGESLGYNSYGPVFLRLDYPNAEDFVRYEEAKDEGLIPRRDDMKYKGPGSGIAIHGTNDNGSLGFYASSGCVRMRNDNIMELSDYVMEGTMVIID
ncbi:MAG TPA: L,D-transpeptidase [Candidatus Goldiibacteriota bacterium]|nr:L,D-transpeptidase [Candidatus Goldiibacteriota bacterium]